MSIKGIMGSDKVDKEGKWTRKKKKPALKLLMIREQKVNICYKIKQTSKGVTKI